MIPVLCRGAVLALAVVLAASVASASTGMYRWVDGNGVVHYSDQKPPANAKGAKKMTLRTGGARSSGPVDAEADKPSEGRQMAKAAGYEEQDIKRNCEIANKNLVSLTAAEPLPEGSEGALNRQRLIETAQAQVKLFCD